MNLPFFLVDAFASGPFTGNPAGVCVLESEAEESWMQDVAMEINQAETAFVWPSEGQYSLRWFTPAVEVDLCGHATLATVHALSLLGKIQHGRLVEFRTRSGVLTCHMTSEGIEMDFPAKVVVQCEQPSSLGDMFGEKLVWFGTNNMDWFVELESESQVLEFVPDHVRIAGIGFRGMIVTAQAETIKADYVSRFFAPGSGIPEDPVTGSAHCALCPYWSAKLGKTRTVGYQASRRGGFVGTRLDRDRVYLTGQARTVVSGTLDLH